MQLNSRNKLIGLLTLVLVITVLSQSALGLNLRRRNRNIEQVNPWSFQIAIDEKINEDEDNDFNGFRLSLKRNYNKHSALRINLGIVDQDITNDENRFFYTDDLTIRMYDWQRYEFGGANLSVQYMFYPSPNDRVNFFWGIGPALGIYGSESNVETTYYGGYSYDWVDFVVCDRFSKFALGVEGSVGMEWFLGRHISLLAEYGFILQNEWYFFELDYYDYDGYVIDKVKGFDDGLHLDASRIKLGMAFYF
jgi:hypothetical protein